MSRMENRPKPRLSASGARRSARKMRDGPLCLVIAYVSGKVLAGCLVTSMLAVLIRTMRDRYDSPREMLIALEDGLLTEIVGQSDPFAATSGDTTGGGEVAAFFKKPDGSSTESPQYASIETAQEEILQAEFDPADAEDKMITPENHLFEDRRTEFYHRDDPRD